MLLTRIFTDGTPDGPLPYPLPFDPSAVGEDYDPLLPLRRPELLKGGAMLTGYDLRRSRFVDLDV